MRVLFLYDLFNPLVKEVDLLTWDLRGRPYPPPGRLKQRTVIEYGRRFGLETFVETGTFLGDMVAATREAFKRIYSIELAPDLHERARRMFREYSHITLLCGDSANILLSLLPILRQPCLFWLDAHFSGSITARGAIDTPIEKELRAILDHPVDGHVILIDDARDFNGTWGYPTLGDLGAYLRSQRPDWVYEIWEGIIRYHPPKRGE